MSLPSLFRSNVQSGRLLARLQSDFDKLFSELSAVEPQVNSELICNCEILEDKMSFTFKFDMPGVKKADVHVRLDGNVMTVSAERTDEKKSEDKKSRFSEVTYGSYQRSFTLPESVEESKIDAKFESGVLTLTVPKSESKRSKTIAIQ